MAMSVEGSVWPCQWKDWYGHVSRRMTIPEHEFEESSTDSAAWAGSMVSLAGKETYMSV